MLLLSAPSRQRCTLMRLCCVWPGRSDIDCTSCSILRSTTMYQFRNGVVFVSLCYSVNSSERSNETTFAFGKVGLQEDHLNFAAGVVMCVFFLPVDSRHPAHLLSVLIVHLGEIKALWLCSPNYDTEILRVLLLILLLLLYFVRSTS